jgi:hypothetical protein
MPKWFLPFIIVGLCAVFLIEKWTRPDFSKESASVDRFVRYRSCVTRNVDAGLARMHAVDKCKDFFSTRNP